MGVPRGWLLLKAAVAAEAQLALRAPLPGVTGVA